MKKSFLVPQGAILKASDTSTGGTAGGHGAVGGRDLSPGRDDGYESGGESRSSSPNRGIDDDNTSKLKKYLQYRDSCWDGTVKEYNDAEWNYILSRNTPMLTDFNVEKAKKEADEMWEFVNSVEMRESLKKIIADKFNLKYEVTKESFLGSLHELIKDADDMIQAILRGGGPSFVDMREQINSHRHRNLFNLDLVDRNKAWKKLNFDSFAGEPYTTAKAMSDLDDSPTLHQLLYVFSIPQTIVDAVTIECDGKVTEDQCKSYIQEYLPSSASSNEAIMHAPVLSYFFSTHDLGKLFDEMDDMDKAQNGDEISGAKKMLTVMLKEYLKRLSEGIRDLVIKIQQNEPLGEYEYQGEKTKDFRFYHEQIKLIKENMISFSSESGTQIQNIFNIGELLVDIIPRAAGVAPEPQTESSTPSLFSKVTSFFSIYNENYIKDISAKLSKSELTTLQMSDITEKAIRAATKIKA